MRAAATTAVVAGTASAVSGRVNRGQQEAAQQAADAQAQEEQQAMAAAPPPPVEAAPPPVAGLSPEAVQELKDLAGLHEQGILTDDEFAAEKKKILGS